MDLFLSPGWATGCFQPPDQEQFVYHAWFNWDRLDEKLRDTDKSPITFHQIDDQVILSTVVVENPLGKSPSQCIPEGYCYPLDYQGVVDLDKSIQPTAARSWEVINKFEQLRHTGIKAARIWDSCCFGKKLCVTTMDGASHKIRLG